MSDTILSAARASEIASTKHKPTLVDIKHMPTLLHLMQEIRKEAEKGNHCVFTTVNEATIRKQLEDLGYGVIKVNETQYAVVW